MRVLILLIFAGLISFTASAQMVLSGSATGGCDCYELTDGTNQAGSIWSPSTIDLTNSFDLSFDINAGANDVWGADGMSFVLRQSGTSTGALGNGLGYSGITPSIGIEVDTWNSSPTVPTDIASDHLAMNSGGTVNHTEVAPIAIANIEDDLYHTFRITWDPITLDLEVFLDGVSTLTYTGDMVTLFFAGNPNVYFGWSGGTGGVFNVQTVCMYRNADFSSDLVTACEGQEISFTDESSSDLIYNTEEVVSWDWDFDDGTTSSDQNPVHTFAAVGTYTVSLTITDISGCTDTYTFDITITEGLDLTMSHTDVSCFGLDDGTGTALPITGTGPYTYLWDDPLTQITETSIDLAPDTYVVLVTDALGCMGIDSITISEPTELVFDVINTTNASCGIANGTITFTAAGGTPGYQYSIDGGVTYFPTGDFIDLANGTYTIEILDANGCTATTTVAVGLDSPLVIDDITVTDVSCGPTDDGTISITASAGAAPFQYSIDGGITYQASNYFDLLSPGTYTVVVEDDAGCAVSEIVVVSSLSGIEIDLIDFIEPTCNGGTDGELTIEVSGGTAPFQYSIDGGITFFPANIFTGLAGGSYDIQVIDAAGCDISTTAIITEPTLTSIDDIITTPISCNGLMDGAFELLVSGGTPGYTYSFDAGLTFQLSPIFTDLSMGTYDLLVEDSNGCLITGTTMVSEPDELLIDDILVVDVTCNGLMDGEIGITAMGGTAPFNYRIDGGAYQLSPNFIGLGGGVIVIEVMDDNGCMTSGDAFIDESDPIVLSLGIDTTICLGGEATLCPTISGGTAPYSFIWDGIPSTECLNTAVIGTHDLQVEDANSCTSEIVEQTVLQYMPLTVFSASGTTICPGDNVAIAGEASGSGPEGYSYEWTNDIDGVTLDGPVQIVSPEITTNYTLTVSTGCENMASTIVTITTYPIPDILFTTNVDEGCEDLLVRFESSIDPAAITSQIWDFGDGRIGAGSIVSNLYDEADCYDVNLAITTIDGCRSDATFTDRICVWKMPVADFSYEPTNPNLLELSVEFINASEFADTYEWTFGDGHVSAMNNPTNEFPEWGNKTYEVELIAITDKGCSDTISKKIKVEDVNVYFIPNAFTPNSDLFNQTFKPIFLTGFYPVDYHFVILNRWGEVLWESYDFTKAWDGTYAGQIVDDGVYVWQLTFMENASDKKHQEIGHLTVIK